MIRFDERNDLHRNEERGQSQADIMEALLVRLEELLDPFGVRERHATEDGANEHDE